MKTLLVAVFFIFGNPLANGAELPSFDHIMRELPKDEKEDREISPIVIPVKWAGLEQDEEEKGTLTINHVTITDESIRFFHAGSDWINRFFFRWIPKLPESVFDRKEGFKHIGDLNRELGVNHRSNGVTTTWCFIGSVDDHRIGVMVVIAKNDPSGKITTIKEATGSFDSTEDETRKHDAQDDQVEYRGKKLSSYPKVPLVQSIYDVSSAALDQKWSRQTWVIRFGEPSSNQLLSNGSEIIRYADYGPYQPPPAKNFLNIVNIRLDNGETAKITYNHTSLFE